MEGLSGVAVGQLVIVEGSNNSEMVGKVLRFTPKGLRGRGVRSGGIYVPPVWSGAVK